MPRLRAGHPYVEPNFAALAKVAGPGRVSLTCGDSRHTLPAAAAHAAAAAAAEAEAGGLGATAAKADLVHIDGGHKFEVVR